MIPDWANQVGLDRYRISLEYRTLAERFSKKGDALEALLLGYNSGQLLPDVYGRIGKISGPTVYRWDKKLRDNNDDYRCLCDQRGKWTKGGAKGAGQIGPQAEMTFLRYYLTGNRPSISMAYKLTAFSLEKEGAAIPSEASFRRFFRRYDARYHDVVVLKREGEKALKDQVENYLTRDDRVLKVGEVLVADGKVLNFDILHPLTKKPCRMILICFFDWRSRMPVGWEIMPTENTIAIASAYRMACLTLGGPARVAYLDNGRAFKSKFFSQSGSDLKELDGLYARLGTAVQHAMPYNGRAKVVERFFGTMDHQCERFIDSYRGPSIDQKPARLMRNETYHRKRHNPYIPTIQEAAQLIQGYVAWYSRQHHEGINARPIDVFEAGRGDALSPDQLVDLDRHFLWRHRVTPKRCRFTIPGTQIEFESEQLYGLNMEIIVRYSWSDLSTVYLFDKDGVSIGEATPVKAVHPMAKHLGSYLDMYTLNEAHKKLRRARKQTYELASELDMSISDTGLDKVLWAKEKEPLALVPKPKKAEQVEPEALSESERQRLEALKQKALTEASQQPTYKRPDRPASRLERYEQLFQIHFRDGHALLPEDAEFMAEYEESDEYQSFTGRRFEQLRASFRAIRSKTEAM